MVLRAARRGRNAGRQFYGCSRYPACKGVVDSNRKSDRPQIDADFADVRKDSRAADDEQPHWTLIAKFANADPRVSTMLQNIRAAVDSYLAWRALRDTGAAI